MEDCSVTPGCRQPVLKCGVCHRIYRSRKALARHVYKHEHPAVFTCSDCGKTFPTKTRLNIHSRVHSGDRPFKCSYCPVYFASTFQLKLHHRRHTGEKPYVCSYCQKSFSSSSGLQQHVKTHTNESPFACSQCSRSFKQREKLKQHERIHTGVRPYMCDQCPSTFRVKNSLVRHLRIHSGEMFKCTLCPKEFGELYSLKKHHRRQHGQLQFTSPAKKSISEDQTMSLDTDSSLAKHITSSPAKVKKDTLKNQKQQQVQRRCWRKVKHNSDLELNKIVAEKLHLAVGHQDVPAVVDEYGWHRIPLSPASDFLNRNQQPHNGNVHKVTAVVNTRQQCDDQLQVQTSSFDVRKVFEQKECLAADICEHKPASVNKPDQQGQPASDRRRETTRPSTIEYFPSRDQPSRCEYSDSRDSSQFVTSPSPAFTCDVQNPGRVPQGDNLLQRCFHTADCGAVSPRHYSRLSHQNLQDTEAEQQQTWNPGSFDHSRRLGQLGDQHHTASLHHHPDAYPTGGLPADFCVHWQCNNLSTLQETQTKCPGSVWPKQQFQSLQATSFGKNPNYIHHHLPGSYQQKSLDLTQLPTSSGVIQVPTSSGLTQVPTSSGLTQVPTSSGLTQLPTSSGLTQVPTSSGLTQIPTSSGVTQVPTSSGLTQLPTSSDVTQLPTSSDVTQLPTSSGASQLHQSSFTVTLPTSSPVPCEHKSLSPGAVSSALPLTQSCVENTYMWRQASVISDQQFLPQQDCVKSNQQSVSQHESVQSNQQSVSQHESVQSNKQSISVKSNQCIFERESLKPNQQCRSPQESVTSNCHFSHERCSIKSVDPLVHDHDLIQSNQQQTSATADQQQPAESNQLEPFSCNLCLTGGSSTVPDTSACPASTLSSIAAGNSVQTLSHLKSGQVHHRPPCLGPPCLGPPCLGPAGKTCSDNCWQISAHLQQPHSNFHQHDLVASFSTDVQATSAHMSGHGHTFIRGQPPLVKAIAATVDLGWPKTTSHTKIIHKGLGSGSRRLPSPEDKGLGSGSRRLPSLEDMGLGSGSRRLEDKGLGSGSRRLEDKGLGSGSRRLPSPEDTGLGSGSRRLPSPEDTGLGSGSRRLEDTGLGSGSRRLEDTGLGSGSRRLEDTGLGSGSRRLPSPEDTGLGSGSRMLEDTGLGSGSRRLEDTGLGSGSRRLEDTGLGSGSRRLPSLEDTGLGSGSRMLEDTGLGSGSRRLPSPEDKTELFDENRAGGGDDSGDKIEKNSDITIDPCESRRTVVGTSTSSTVWVKAGDSKEEENTTLHRTSKCGLASNGRPRRSVCVSKYRNVSDVSGCGRENGRMRGGMSENNTDSGLKSRSLNNAGWREGDLKSRSLNNAGWREGDLKSRSLNNAGWREGGGCSWCGLAACRRESLRQMSATAGVSLSQHSTSECSVSLSQHSTSECAVSLSQHSTSECPVSLSQHSTSQCAVSMSQHSTSQCAVSMSQHSTSECPGSLSQHSTSECAVSLSQHSTSECAVSLSQHSTSECAVSLSQHITSECAVSLSHRGVPHNVFSDGLCSHRSQQQFPQARRAIISSCQSERAKKDSVCCDGIQATVSKVRRRSQGCMRPSDRRDGGKCLAKLGQGLVDLCRPLLVASSQTSTETVSQLGLIQDHVHVTPGNHACPPCGTDYSQASQLEHHQQRRQFHKVKHQCDICSKHQCDICSKHQCDICSKHQCDICSKHQCDICSKHQCDICSKHQCDIYSKHQCDIYSKHQCDICSKHQCDIYSKHQCDICSKHQCDICSKQFPYRSHLQRHMNTHATQKPYPCHLCPQMFTARKYLDNHLRRHNKQPAIFPCTDCRKVFARSYQLKIHMRTHSGEKPYKCSQCSRHFATSFQVQLHERVHSDVRPYQCQHCSKCFRSKANLTLHVKRHINDRPYLCAICGAAFYEASKLTAHGRVHTGVHPFMCDQCPKSFKVKHLLVRHLRWHSGDTFNCEHCNKQFDEQWTLRAHIARRHSGK